VTVNVLALFENFGDWDFLVDVLLDPSKLLLVRAAELALENLRLLLADSRLARLGHNSNSDIFIGGVVDLAEVVRLLGEELSPQVLILADNEFFGHFEAIGILCVESDAVEFDGGTFEDGRRNGNRFAFGLAVLAGIGGHDVGHARLVGREGKEALHVGILAPATNARIGTLRSLAGPDAHASMSRLYTFSHSFLSMCVSYDRPFAEGARRTTYCGTENASFSGLSAADPGGAQQRYFPFGLATRTVGAL
jgi:hypothetical protein